MYFVISANVPPSNFINYIFFSVSCLLAISKRFGLPELLQSACKVVIATANNGCVRLHQIPAIPESVSRSVPFDYIIPELEWQEFISADSGLEAEY